MSQISKHLECSICSMFFFQPYRFKCGHTFCKDCVLNLKRSVVQIQLFKCPQCRKPVEMQFVSEDLIARSMIEEQIVYCLNRMQCCIWKGPLNSLEEHMSKCDFRESDKLYQQLVDLFDKDVRSRTMSSELNTTTPFATQIDEKLQENINNNVGESLFVRLMNKNKAIGQELVRQMSQNDNHDSQKDQAKGLKRVASAVELSNPNTQNERPTQKLDSKESKLKLEGIIDELLSDEESQAQGEEIDEIDELMSFLMATGSMSQSQNTNQPKKANKGKKISKNTSDLNGEQAPQKQGGSKRVGKKRLNTEPVLDSSALQFTQKLKLFSANLADKSL